MSCQVGAAQARACERLADDLREGSLSEVKWCKYSKFKCYISYLNLIVHFQGTVNREPPAAGAAQEQAGATDVAAAVAWGGWRGLRWRRPH